MLSSRLENQLIFPDIADLMQQYCSVQLDIDETRIKAACIMAQNLDLKRLIGQENIDRVTEREGEVIEGADLELKYLLEAPLCYFTYSRMLLNFQGNLTDSGLEVDQLATSINQAKSVAKNMKGAGEAYMADQVIPFLKAEDIDTVADETKLVNRVKVFGGKENRACN